MNYRRYYLPLIALLLTPFIAVAQEQDTLDTQDYQAERHVIESALGTMVKVIRTATFRDQNSSVQSELHDLAAKLNAVNQSLPSVPMTVAAKANAQNQNPNSPQPTSLSDLQSLENALSELSDQIRDIRRTLEAEEDYELADRLAPVEKGIDNAVVQTRRMIFTEQSGPTIAKAEIENEDPWLTPGAYREGKKVSRSVSALWFSG